MVGYSDSGKDGLRGLHLSLPLGAARRAGEEIDLQLELFHGRGGSPSRGLLFFDIDWSPGDPSLQDKVLLPILGRPYGKALAMR